MYGKKWKRTKWMIPLLAASLIMPFSSMGKAAMANEQPVTAEESGQFHRPVTNTARATSPGGLEVTNPGNESSTVGVGEGQDQNANPVDQTNGKADGSIYPTYTEAYDRMIALKNQEEYAEGTTWTNFEPYGSKGTKGDAYTWHGGKIKGSESGVGCAAFAFILSDEAFGNLPATSYDRGNFKFDDVKVGDILRVNGNSHFVIVLQKSEAGVIVAEGNYNKSVHWGRAMTVAEVMDADFIISRYPKDHLPSDANEANDVVAEGDVDNLHWKLTKARTLTISGSGAIPDYTVSDAAPWSAHNDSISTIVIGDGVTSIGNYAFYQSNALTASLASTVKTIGDNAFGDSHLIAVTVPDGVENIGSEAFRACVSLTYIDFPASISSIGAGAFMSCTAMKSVRFMPGSNAVTIGENIFSQCTELTNVILPQTIDCIKTGMFQSCWALPLLYLPKSVQTIELNAFASCNSLTISFGGSEAEWTAIKNKSPYVKPQLDSITVKYDVEFVDPFAPIPGDPGDFNPDGTETPPEEPAPEVHEHNWSADWASDENNHWHECGTQGCPVSDNSQKDGYAEHTYGNWVTDQSASAYQSGTKHRDCTVCGYQQSGTIPATGGSSSGSGSGSSGGSSWSPGGGSWSSGGNYWNPGSSSSSSSNNSSSSSTNDTDKTDNDKTDSSSNETDNNAGAVDNSGSENSSAGSDNNAGSTNDVEASENNTDNASSSVEIAKAKKQLKTEMKTQMKATMKTQIKKELKPQLKAQIKKLLKKQAQIKPKAKAKLKTKLKKDLKQELKATLKAKLKAQLKKEFGKQLGDQFIEEFNTQFNKQFNALYNEQFNKQFQTQFKQLTS